MNTRKIHQKMSFYREQGVREKAGHNHEFIKPKLSTTPMLIDTNTINISNKKLELLNKLHQEPMYQPVLDDVGKSFYPGITNKSRTPVPLDLISIKDLHQLIAPIGPGVIDMKIKSGDSTDIILPIEFEPLRDMLTACAIYEKHLNKEFSSWNMWLLVDRRPVKAGYPQRNGGAHCDGFRMSEPELQQTSVYTWSNTLPTEATNSSFPLPETFNPNTQNFSSLLTRDWDENSTIITKPNVIYRMDGHTPHRGKISDVDIDDRVFIRVCFTAKNKEFNRLGNTENPCMQYPDNYWVKVFDPASRLKNITNFTEPKQFIRMWENACQGHPSYGIQGSGKNSHEQGLIQELKKRGPLTLNNIFKNYKKIIANNKDTYEIQEMRLSILKSRVF